MNRRGEQLLTMVLAGCCAVLFVLALLFQFGVGAGYGWLPSDTDAQSNLGAGSIDANTFKLPPESEFDVIHERPLFNEDRKPAPDEPVQDAKADEPPPAPLNINLTGTVRSPGMAMVLIQEKQKNQSIALKEGMPLPGDLGSWTLTKVKSRSAIFKSSVGEEVEVELTAAASSPKNGVAPRPGSQPTPAPGGAPAPTAFGPGPATTGTTKGPGGGNQSEDLQHRIEERRQQMREAAERNRKQNQQNDKNPQNPQQQPTSPPAQ